MHRKLKIVGEWIQDKDVEIVLFLFVTPLLLLFPLPLGLAFLVCLVIIVAGIAQSEHYLNFETDHGLL